MALAKKCDRCGKFYDHYPTGDKLQNNAIKMVHKTAEGLIHGKEKSLDLCPECMKKFDEFMIKGKF